MHLIPNVGANTAIERRLSQQILKLNPGLGEKSVALAEILADSGISPAAATMLLQAVYQPDLADGRGQATRVKWFVETIQNRYSHKIDKIRKDPKQFRLFIADMEEATEIRDILKGEGVNISFEETFLLWEIGLDADSILGLIQSECEGISNTGVAIKHVLRAAQLVKDGVFLELETAIQSMRHGYQYERTV